jgi:hypothetical protein
MKNIRTYSVEIIHKNDSSRIFLDKLGKKLGFKKPEDWYNLQLDDLRNGSKSLLRFGSVAKLVQYTYPEHKWLHWKFIRVSTGYWDKQENARNFLDWLSQQLGFQSMEDWYGVTIKDFHENGGATLLLKYKDSFPKLLETAYPQHQWMIWKFERISEKMWGQLEQRHRIQLTHWLTKELMIVDLDDWYRVSRAQLRRNVSLAVFSKYPLEQLLQESYPHYNWDIDKLRLKHNNIVASQKILIKILQDIFPSCGKNGKHTNLW